MTWHFFAWVYAGAFPPIQAIGAGIIGGMTAYVAPILKAGVLAYMAGYLLFMALGADIDPLSESEKLILKAAVVITIAASTAGYTYWVHDLMTALPNELGRIVSSQTGSPAINGELFDGDWNKAFAAGLTVYKGLAWDEIALKLLVLVYWVAAIFAIGIAFFMWLFANLIVELLIDTGPIFVACALFPLVNRLFYGWFSVLLGVIILQVFILAVVGLIIGTENKLIAMIFASSGDNSFGNIRGLLVGVLLYIGSLWLLKQLPGLAASISGGFSAATQGIHRSAFAGAAAGGALGANVAAGAAVRALAAAGLVASASPSRAAAQTAPGRSISN